MIEMSESVGTTPRFRERDDRLQGFWQCRENPFHRGQTVKAGDILIELDVAERKADLEAARAAIQTAPRPARGSEPETRRAQQLRRAGAGTEALVADLTLQLRTVETTVAAAEARERAAAARLDDYIVRAPFAGRVGLRQVSLGAFVDNKGDHHHAR